MVENGRGTPLELRGKVEFWGIREVVLEPEGQEAFVPKMREGFGAYALYMMSGYVKNLRLRGLEGPDATAGRRG